MTYFGGHLEGTGPLDSAEYDFDSVRERLWKPGELVRLLRVVELVYTVDRQQQTVSSRHAAERAEKEADQLVRFVNSHQVARAGSRQGPVQPRHHPTQITRSGARAGEVRHYAREVLAPLLLPIDLGQDGRLADTRGARDPERTAIEALQVLSYSSLNALARDEDAGAASSEPLVIGSFVVLSADLVGARLLRQLKLGLDRRAQLFEQPLAQRLQPPEPPFFC